jgi:cytochrome c oxidase subunit 2
MDEMMPPSTTIKVLGRQWYWAYQYSDFVDGDGESIESDSYMIPETDLEEGPPRLLEVDDRAVVLVDLRTQFIVTGADVIHDFAVPALRSKIDCGHTNQTCVLEQYTTGSCLLQWKPFRSKKT